MAEHDVLQLVAMSRPKPTEAGEAPVPQRPPRCELPHLCLGETRGAHADVCERTGNEDINCDVPLGTLSSHAAGEADKDRDRRLCRPSEALFFNKPVGDLGWWQSDGGQPGGSRGGVSGTEHSSSLSLVFPVMVSFSGGALLDPVS